MDAPLASMLKALHKGASLLPPGSKGLLPVVMRTMTDPNQRPFPAPDMTLIEEAHAARQEQ
jgi:hypothetical protein